MSAQYASGLSPYGNKGRCGTKEFFDSDKKVTKSIETLAGWMMQSKHCVLYCGAGISTAAGIADFRGPKGIWTMEMLGLQAKSVPNDEKPLDQYIPTYTHCAIRSLVNVGLVKHIVSQNIDGLFLRSGIDRKFLSELHGNYFIDQCDNCMECYIRTRPSPTLGCIATGDTCPNCAGQLFDTILDWDQELPMHDYRSAQLHSSQCDLAICLGTSLQISPFNELAKQVCCQRRSMTRTNRSSKDRPLNKLVIINLQKTGYDSDADLVIHQYCDQVMHLLMETLGISPAGYSILDDPVKTGPDLARWVAKIEPTEDIDQSKDTAE